jgi:hypothetical protein
LPVVQVIGGAVLIVAATVVPWAYYRLRGSVASHWLSAGGFSWALVIAGVLAIVFGALQLVEPGTWLPRLNCVTGAAAAVIAVATALSRMAHANDLTVNSGGTTSYSLGGPLGVGATLAIGIAAVVAAQRP